ncbi:MAG: NAD(P)-dependent oxidoreductase [Candidatus Nanopelagicaceae bacterium]
MILISEDVWGAPFEELSKRRSIHQDSNLWEDRSKLIEAIKDAQALVVRNRTKVTAELIAAAPKLKIIARAGVGLDNIDILAADSAGVVVVAGLSANAVAVAELTLSLALALSRDIANQDQITKAGSWSRTPGIEISGKTWGLLGCGATGRATANLLKGFNCKVLGYDPFFQGNPEIQMASWDEVISQADVISVHMPATNETVGSLNKDIFAKMKPTALLINVGRGELVNEQDLITALKEKSIAGAALDVRASEPPTTGELETLKNVILTPHIAGITKESQLAINKILVKNIDLVLDGKKATHAVGKV